MQHSKEGLISVHLAVFIFGMTALFSKVIALSATDITFLRSLFAIATIWAFMQIKGEKVIPDNRRDFTIATLLGILLTAHWVTYFHAMQVSSVAIGVIALYTFPVITVFLEPIFHGEKPHQKDIISAISVVLGIYLIVPDFSWDNTATQGILWGVLSALFFALRNILQKRYFSHYSASQSLFYQNIIVAITLIPFSVTILPQVNSFQWAQLLILGIFFTALPHTLFAHSLLFLKAKTASLIACMQVVYATIFAAIFIAEFPSTMTLIGGAIIVIAAAYESISPQQKILNKT